MTSKKPPATDTTPQVFETASNLRKLGENAIVPLGGFMDPNKLGAWLGTNDDVLNSMRQWSHQATIYMAHWLRRLSSNFTAKHGHTAWRKVDRFLVPGSAESIAWSELVKFHQWDTNLCAEKVAEWRREGIVVPEISGAEVAYVIDDGGLEVATELFAKAETILRESRRLRSCSQETQTKPALPANALNPQLPITITYRVVNGVVEVVAKCRGRSTAPTRITKQVFATLHFFGDKSKVNELLTGSQLKFYRALALAIGKKLDACADDDKLANLCRQAASRTNRRLASILQQIGIDRPRVIEKLSNAGYRLSESIRIRDPLADEGLGRSRRNPRMGRAIVSSPLVEASRNVSTDSQQASFDE